MLSSRLYAALFLTFSIALVAHTNSASGCSVGIPTPEQLAMQAETELKESDLVAEGTVVSFLDMSKYEKECRALLAEGQKRCETENNDPFCVDIVDRILETCQADGGARMRFGPAWKGQVRDFEDVFYIKEQSCGGFGFDPALGETNIICGWLDHEGRLQVSACAADGGVVEGYRDKWRALNTAVHDKPDDLGSHVKLAEFYEYWGDKRGAVAIYDEICTSMPDTAAGCAGAGRILFDQKRFAEAVPYLQQAFDRDPANQNNAALLQRTISLAQQ